MQLGASQNELPDPSRRLRQPSPRARVDATSLKCPDLRRCLVVLCLTGWLQSVAAADPADGVTLVGRWLESSSGATATYAGSEILLHFTDSSSVAADFSVSNTQLGTQDLYIAVTIDGGKPVRFGLSAGVHRGLVLASGLSSGPHVVTIRKEGEAAFGALGFANPQLSTGGRWRSVVDDRPIVEVIGDSDATGICALGPDSPAAAANIFTSAWASQTVSWVGMLESGLAAVGHPVAMVDLAISGSDAKEEAAAYDYTAFSYSDTRFGGYASGRRHASLVFLWGGANDHAAGGDTVQGSTVTYDNLSPFQVGVYTQLRKILTRNPDVRIVLLDYIDVVIPTWRPAYEQVLSLFSAAQRQQMFLLSVRDPKGDADACEVDPKGHPNIAQHTVWAAQILVWMMSSDRLRQLGLPSAERWDQ